MRESDAILTFKDDSHPKITILGFSVDKGQAAEPGMFLMLKAPGMFLRRPMAYLSSAPDRFTVAVETIGPGTEALRNMRIGDKTSVIGPLGNGFPKFPSGRKIVLMGGGTGAAPLLMEAGRLKKEGADFRLFLGFNTAADVCFRRELKELNGSVCTMDGSEGLKGNPVDNALKECGPDCLAVTVGPIPMMKAVQSKFKDGYLSLDTRMGCGYGVCNGCDVKGSDGRVLYVCKDGPVFPLKEVTL